MPPVSVFVTSPDTHSERKFDSSLTVEQLKASVGPGLLLAGSLPNQQDKLVPVTGIQPQYQQLRLYRSTEEDTPIASLDNDSATLKSYGIVDWYNIRVDSTDPTARPGEFSDLSAVDKFELTPEEYASRSDTVLSHLRANKLGRFADVPAPIAHAPPPPASMPAGIAVGARCEVGEARRGTVRFVGPADIARGGVWVGVELDEPMGKGDGEVEGKRYFTCPPKHAVFVRPDKVTVGDFPEVDLMGDDDDDEI